MRAIKGLRTLLTNGVVVVGSVIPLLIDLSARLSDPNALQGVVSDNRALTVAFAMGVVNMVLRYYTTTPIGRSE